MKITGIIAEYNPFHNGHLYQIQKIRKETDTDYVIVVLSGDFVQRGEPAIIDKYARTKMALSCGADLVVELPSLWACSSAETFAAAGVALLDLIGCVDTICFGAEDANLSLLSQIADVLVEEPASYKKALSDSLKAGKSFPAARMQALLSYFSENTALLPETSEKNDVAVSNTISTILSSPNNILAVEYLKALKLRNSSICPYVIRRAGAGYHDDDIHAPNASATAIRQVLHSGSDLSCTLSAAMPHAAADILEDYLSASCTVTADDFSAILNYLLLLYPPEQLCRFADCNASIANRLKKNLTSFSSYTQFANLNKSRDITYTRMSRIFSHILLQITDDDYRIAKELDYVPYVRPLGFCREAAPLFAQIKKHSAIPLLGKPASARKELTDRAFPIFEKDVFAADLYEQIKAKKSGGRQKSEYARQMVVWD